MELFDYSEVFYNQRRRHSTLGQISPAAFERRATVVFFNEKKNRQRRTINSTKPSTESDHGQATPAASWVVRSF